MASVREQLNAAKGKRYRLQDVTRIGFGGRYEDALALVAGLVPARRRGRRADA